MPMRTRWAARVAQFCRSPRSELTITLKRKEVRKMATEKFHSPDPIYGKTSVLKDSETGERAQATALTYKDADRIAHERMEEKSERDPYYTPPHGRK